MDATRMTSLSGPVRDWFVGAFPDGPTPAQAEAWPIIAAGENLLLISPTGTGKTLAAFLALIERLYQEFAAGTLQPGIRCVYVSPLRSLGYDIERNLARPLAAIQQTMGWRESPIRVGVRTGDTSPYQRRKLRDHPPEILITTPESLALMLSQKAWDPLWRSVRTLVLDEVHALVASKRGADLAVSIERLAAKAEVDPSRVGLSATCRPPEPVARFLVGPDRPCRVIEAVLPKGTPPLVIDVESLIKPDEAPHRGLSYRRLIRRLKAAIDTARTTVIFANTRALTEKITHDLRRELNDPEGATIAAHHSALDAERRRLIEDQLKAGQLRAVVTSTSLELGVDISEADLSVLVGLPGSVSRCLQRVGRAGHQVGVQTRGLILAGSVAELAGAIVTAAAAGRGDVEALRPIQNPLDVVCQQLIGMACGGEWSSDAAYALLRRSAPMAQLSRADFDDCLSFLAGELAAPPGAFEPEPGSSPRWTSPRVWKRGGLFGIKNSRIIRWFWSNVGTITSEESIRVQIDGQTVGTLEAAYAERLQAGDRFILDGRSFEYRRIEGLIVHVKATGEEANLPRWSSDRQGLSAELARELAQFRVAAARLMGEDSTAFRSWLAETHDLGKDEVGVLENLLGAQEQISEIPTERVALVEEYPDQSGQNFTYAFHAPLGRPACEAIGRAMAARLGRKFGRDLTLEIADLGWSLTLSDGQQIPPAELHPLFQPARFEEDVLEGLDRGELLARRFRHVAATALMVLRRPEGKRTKVGGLLWVSQRLFPLVQAACPHHPLLREARREVLEEVLDSRTALLWLESGPEVRFRVLDGPSPFAATWISPGGPEPIRYESPGDALKRLHHRLVSS